MSLTAGARLGPVRSRGPRGLRRDGRSATAPATRASAVMSRSRFCRPPLRTTRTASAGSSRRPAPSPLSPTRTSSRSTTSATHNGAPFLVSELLEGRTLRDSIRTDGLPIHQAVEWAVQIARGLAAAHGKGIVHRDLKPANVFVTTDGQVKILDFGLAKLARPDADAESSAPTAAPMTEVGAVMGTAGYMAPEQVRGLPCDPRTDLFAFGCVLYEMLSGQRAFKGPTPADTLSAILKEDPAPLRDLRQTVLPGLQQIVDRCLEKRPEDRFSSAHDVALALQAASSSAEAVATRGTGVRVTVPTHRWRLVAAGVLLLVGLAGGAWFGLRSHSGLRAFGWSPTPAKLTDKDMIVLADFDNKTGDPVFDDTLRQGLSVALEQSPFLNLLSDQRVNETLKLMSRPAGDRAHAGGHARGLRTRGQQGDADWLDCGAGPPVCDRSESHGLRVRGRAG